VPGQIETIEVGAKLFFRGPFVTNGEATPADPTHGFVIRDGTKSSESDFSRTRTRWATGGTAVRRPARCRTAREGRIMRLHWSGTSGRGSTSRWAEGWNESGRSLKFWR
jgi:hypothetical protein